MKRSLKLFGMALTLLAVPAAYAGLKTDFFVSIDTTNRTAYGAFGTARNSTDTIQRLYCRTFASTTSESLRCFATNAVGTTVTCSSSSPTLIRSAQSISEGSYVYFSWDTNGICEALDVLKGSHLAPKAP